MNSSKIRVAIMVFLVVLGSLAYANIAKADTSLSVGGVTLSVPANIYEPTGYDSVKVNIGFENNTGTEILQVGYIVTDAYGKVITRDSKIGVPAGTSGLIVSTWYGYLFSGATKPLSITLTVARFGGLGDLESSAALTLLTKPESAPVSPVTTKATPVPAPTVTVTATPVPAPTVTVTATPSSSVTIPNWVANQLDAYKLQIEALETDSRNLKAKLKKICANKPKPKGC